MSNLNCRPGDLCVIVRSWAGNEGRIVRALWLATTLELDVYFMDDNYGPVWVVDKDLQTTHGDSLPFGFDCCMRPILPPPGSVTDSEVKELYSPRTVTPSAPRRNPVPIKEHS